MIWSLLARGIYHTLGALQTAGEFISTGKRLVRDMRKGVIPHVDDTDPIPLTHKDAEQGYNSPKVVTETLKLPKPPRVPRI